MMTPTDIVIHIYNMTLTTVKYMRTIAVSTHQLAVLLNSIYLHSFGLHTHSHFLISGVWALSNLIIIFPHSKVPSAVARGGFRQNWVLEPLGWGWDRNMGSHDFV